MSLSLLYAAELGHLDHRLPNHHKEALLNRRVVGVVLLIAGVLVFLWAMSQISNMPPDFLMPSQIVRQNQARESMYRTVQVVAALVAVSGGALIVLTRSA